MIVFMLNSVSHFWSSSYNSQKEFIEYFGSLPLDHYFCAVSDNEGHFHFINSVLIRHISSLDLDKVSFMELLNPEIDTILLSDLLLHIKKRIPWQGEITLKFASEKILWLDGIISPIIIDDKPLFAFLFNDISERKIVEKALQGSRQYFSNLIQHIPAGIFLANLDGECVMTNGHWNQITGRSFAKSVGTKWINSLHPDDKERVKSWWALSVSSSILSPIEFRYLDGSKSVYVLVNVVKIEDPFLRQTQYLRVEKDITDLKNSQMLFARKERQLLEASKIADFSTLVIGMAHELNNPLAIIKGLVRAIKKDFSNDIIKKDFASDKLKKIDLYIDRTAKVIEVLNRLSSTGNAELRQEFMIMPMLEIVKEMLSTEFPSCTEQIVILISDPNLMMSGIKKDIELVYYQLLKNALIHRESHYEEDLHSKVQVKIEEYKDELIFSVIDYGKGIMQVNIQNLFKPYFKLNSGGVGVGLGLALAWKSMIMHSGSIQLISPSKPTVFKINIPKTT